MSKVNESARSRNNYSVIRSLEVELAWLQHRGAVMTRRRLPNRRLAETFDLEVGGLRYVASIGRFADGALAEVFLSVGGAGCGPAGR